MKVTTDGCLFGAWIAEQASHSNNIKKALDIGAGTGLLSLMLAQKDNSSSITAIEVDKEAALQAEENFEASPRKKNLEIIHTDIKTFSPLTKFDLIISNPPFYEKELESPDTQKNLAHHSGGLSLDELLKVIATHLETDGVFFLLMPFKRKDEIGPLLKKHSLYITEHVLVSQSTKHEHFRIMIKGGKQEKKEIKISELSIWDNNHQYTPAFTELLKDYYLKL
jgi:tRNA1Val (adenine37-N6)-methyltransferase